MKLNISQQHWEILKSFGIASHATGKQLQHNNFIAEYKNINLMWLYPGFPVDAADVSSPDFIDPGQRMHHHHLFLGNSHNMRSQDELTKTLRMNKKIRFMCDHNYRN